MDLKQHRKNILDLHGELGYQQFFKYDLKPYGLHCTDINRNSTHAAILSIYSNAKFDSMNIHISCNVSNVNRYNEFFLYDGLSQVGYAVGLEQCFEKILKFFEKEKINVVDEALKDMDEIDFGYRLRLELPSCLELTKDESKGDFYKIEFWDLHICDVDFFQVDSFKDTYRVIGEINPPFVYYENFKRFKEKISELLLESIASKQSVRMFFTDFLEKTKCKIKYCSYASSKGVVCEVFNDSKFVCKFFVKNGFIKFDGNDRKHNIYDFLDKVVEIDKKSDDDISLDDVENMLENSLDKDYFKFDRYGDWVRVYHCSDYVCSVKPDSLPKRFQFKNALRPFTKSELLARITRKSWQIIEKEKLKLKKERKEAEEKNKMHVEPIYQTTKEDQDKPKRKLKANWNEDCEKDIQNVHGYHQTSEPGTINFDEICNNYKQFRQATNACGQEQKQTKKEGTMKDLTTSVTNVLNNLRESAEHGAKVAAASTTHTEVVNKAAKKVLGDFLPQLDVLPSELVDLLQAAVLYVVADVLKHKYSNNAKMYSQLVVEARVRDIVEDFMKNRMSDIMAAMDMFGKELS